MKLFANRTPAHIAAILVAAPFALGSLACSAPQDQSAGSDTAVHNAEVARGTLDEVMARGEAGYLANCAACHQPDGTGLRGAFPPLAQSDYLLRDRDEVLTAALFGLSGPITVNGEDYNGVMPSVGHLDDQVLADTLTYVLASWGNSGAAVRPAEVSALRSELGQTDRATGQRHQGASEGELRYRGTPSTIEAGGHRAGYERCGPGAVRC